MKRALLVLAACGPHGAPTEPHPSPRAPDGAVALPPDAAMAEIPDAAPPPDTAPVSILPNAKMTVAKPKVTGDVAADTVRVRLRDAQAALLHCYQDQPNADDVLSGKVTVDFTIGDDGAVASAHAEGLDAAIDSCLALIIDTIEFPAPKKTTKAIVEVVLTFSPS